MASDDSSIATPTSACLTMSTQPSLPESSQKSFLFYGEIENFETLTPVLKSIHIKKIAVMAITERGIKITCEEENRTVQATVFVEKGLFTRYEMKNEKNPEVVSFRMIDLLNALAILFPNSSKQKSKISRSLLKIKYENIERIKLQVINENHSAMAYIQTFNLQQSLIVFSMSSVNKIILDVSVLIDFWKCADTTSSRLHLKILDSDPWFEMATDSNRGSFLQRVSAHSVHVEHYECSVPLEEHYEMSAMHFTLRPLLLSSKVSIAMDSNGLLCLQFVIRLDDSSGDFLESLRNHPDDINQKSLAISSDCKKCFVEFYIVPCVD
ncbi:abhydrolase domain-containing protein 16A-like [Sarcoptes scabiei]|nr:abhydrolase domain-containing protein 16A-like [Sarcoptes scabiei]